jgi:molybdopterin synthase catalytic subunit
VRVSVRLFAGLRERAGTDRLEVELPDGARVADVLAAMAATPVGALRPRECVVAVNREYAAADAPVRAGDEVALVPPVSGGAGPDDGAEAEGGGRGPVRLVRVTAEPLEIAALAEAVRDPRAGGVVLFEGVTREVPELDYEAYAEMAVARLEAIAAEEAERHGLCAVAIEHRTGTVTLSEPSVIVAASAPHRGEAFAGARALIDRVKAEAPIWKVEVSAAGRRRVEGTLPPRPESSDPRGASGHR